jgi:Uncharacterized protein conserved in bacteria
LKHTRRRHLQLIAAAAITPALPRVSCAQSWPAKPIRVIIPFTAGSTIDIVARIVFEPLGRQLGQALVIENRGGAGGTVGAAAVARAEPDGYTLMAHSSAHVTTPAIYPKRPTTTAKDFAAVAAFGSSPNVTVVAPEKGIKTLQQLVAAAKAKPGSITFGTAGVGSATHISAEILRFAPALRLCTSRSAGCLRYSPRSCPGVSTSPARPSPPHCLSSARASSWRSR